MKNNPDSQQSHTPQDQPMKIIQGGFKKGMWQYDRYNYQTKTSRHGTTD